MIPKNSKILIVIIKFDRMKIVIFQKAIKLYLINQVKLDKTKKKKKVKEFYYLRNQLKI